MPEEPDQSQDILLAWFDEHVMRARAQQHATALQRLIEQANSLVTQLNQIYNREGNPNV